ncbi:MAG: DNA methyltransferase, partial [Methanothrix sp.]
KETPILVILGNPPYSGISSNTGEWITALIEDYKYVDGKHFGEKKHWLQDDYVKFLRFAEWKIAQSGEGVIGMITNHGYLDNPTFRGMRWHLMQTFDEIYVLNLHGNSLKKERCPDGSKDENVFDIRQGVAIAFFIKCSVAARLRRSVKSAKEDNEHHVFHTELYGTREAKYASLDTHDQGHTDWVKLDPNSPFYFFVPRDEEHAEQYRKFIPVPGILPVKVTGIVTARDKLTIDFEEGSLLAKIRILQDRTLADDYIQEYLAGLLGRAQSKVENYAWRISAARTSLHEISNLKEHVVPILYRPFDNRKIFYHDSVVWRTRVKVMRHMLAGKNVALITPKQHKDEFGAFTTHSIGAHKSVDAYDINYYFPLYLYPTADRADLFSHHEPEERRPNLNPELVAALVSVYDQEPSPEKIFHYVYAVLYAPSYREKYAEFLRTDFPRIPFTNDHELFDELAALGKRLVDLHLLCSDELDPPIAKFEGDGDGIVQTGKNGLRYEPKTQRVLINETQCFEGIPPQVWEYQIGGYQVCHKWLKDRKDRHLSLDEIKTYCQIVTALAKTIEIQTAIDDLYPMVEETLLVVSLH